MLISFILPAYFYILAHPDLALLPKGLCVGCICVGLIGMIAGLHSTLKNAQ